MPWPDRRRIAVSVLGFLVVLALGLPLWSLVRSPFVALYCRAANGAFGWMTFGRGGRARLAPEAETVHRSGEGASADARVTLTVDGYGGEVSLGIGVRHEAYLPLWLFGAVIAVAPLLSARQKVRCLAAGVPLLFALALGAAWLTTAWTFSHRLRGVYDLGSVSRGLLDLAYRVWILPPARPVAVAAAVAAAAFGWQQRRGSGDRRGVVSRS
jgi:hypothetical protein